MDPEANNSETLSLEKLIDSGKAEITISSPEEIIGSPFSSLERVETQQYVQLLGRLGMSHDKVEMRRSSNDQEALIYISSQLTHEINIIHSFKEEEVDKAKAIIRVNDIIFSKKDENMAINVRSLLVGHCEIQYLLNEPGRGNTGTFRRIKLVPSLGADKLPESYEKYRETMEYDRPYNVLTLLHEIAHTRQHENVYKTFDKLPFFQRRDAQESAFEQMGTQVAYIRLQERDAVRFSLQTLRQFRDVGFDLISNLTNTRLINAVEGSLLGYDFQYIKNMDKRFSRRSEHLPKHTDFVRATLNRIRIYREMISAHKKAGI